MAANFYFVTGTDTGVGKTMVSSLLIRSLNQSGKKTVGFKPIASGCDQSSVGLINADGLSLQQASPFDVEYDMVNPFRIQPPIAPHIGLKEQGIEISLEDILAKGQLLAEQTQAEIVIIEGAGGWRVPVNDQFYFSDIAKAFHAEVILTVGMRLGCINHALLTREAILNDQISLLGWVANYIDHQMDRPEENYETLAAILAVPCLMSIPYLQGVSESGMSTKEMDQFDIQLKPIGQSEAV